jgi:ribose transport system substrate-binding protein
MNGALDVGTDESQEEIVGAFVKSSYLALAAAVGFLGAAGQASAEEKKYVVGVSNTLIGNGWREEMVCSVKAEALASGKVSKVILANRNQLSQAA